MKDNNEKGFALVLSLVLLLAMSLMGGALIVISAGDHQSNNTSDEYQQTFYVAETALLEGEKYLLNQYLGPWNTSTHKRDTAKRKMPANGTSNWSGTIVNSNRKNYTTNSGFYYDTSNYCYNSFKDIDKSAFKIVVSESWNFGQIIRDSFNSNASVAEQEEADKLKKYFYEFFLVRIGAAPFRGYGTSIKKGATDSGLDGVAYRVFGCGIRAGKDRMIISLESTVVLPK
tara:strand:+ start:1352 stop:2038 length:687 start_codon:yes stop_codon:yes gene_type:complete